jgi:hypothetical protein
MAFMSAGARTGVGLLTDTGDNHLYILYLFLYTVPQCSGWLAGATKRDREERGRGMQVAEMDG